MFPVQKSLSYKSFKMHKVIHCASWFPEATLGFHDELRRLKKQNKTVINHSFHGPADTTGQCYWAIIIYIFGVLSWLGNGYDGGFSPGGWKLSSFPNIVKKFFRRH